MTKSRNYNVKDALIIDCSGLFTSTTEVQIITLYYNLSLSNDNFFCVKFMLKTEDANVHVYQFTNMFKFHFPFLNGNTSYNTQKWTI